MVVREAAYLTILLSLIIRHGDHALVGQISFFTPGLFAGKLGKISFHSGNDVNMGFLHIEKERSGHRVGTIGDSLEGRCFTFDDRSLDDVGILVKIGESEDT